MLSRLLGTCLSGCCAGEYALAWYSEGIASTPASMHLTSPSFCCGGTLPERFAGKGVGLNLSPALAWGEVPTGTRELVLIVEDADAPLPKPFVHLLVTGIPPELRELHEGALSGCPPPPLALGRNSFGRTTYVVPRALPRHGEHRFAFQLFALDSQLMLSGPARRGRLLTVIKNKVISRAKLDGLFERV